MTILKSTKTPSEGLSPSRKQVDIDVGSFVSHDDSIYRIEMTLDFETVIARNVESGRSTPLKISELKPLLSDSEGLPFYEISEISDEDFQKASQRFEAIKPLLDKNYIGRHHFTIRADEVKISTATLYRWFKKFKAIGNLTALVPQKRGWKKGNVRIKKQINDIILEVIEDYFLSRERPTIRKTCIEIERRCYFKGFQPPNPGTVRARINDISEKTRLRERGYREKAKNKFMPVPGKFPNADFPLSVMQIDHTELDIILVDDVDRKPIGRPWITLAIDVYSRMVLGYYLSFESPSETSVAMCVAHSILPKDELLLLHKVDGKWPVWGFPKTIHVDNGADFRSNNFRNSCLIYGINLDFRPVKQPRFGGHIERLIGTVVREIHSLPGTTFSSIKHREGYDSEKNAVFTKTEFEEWLVTFVCTIYHHRLHNGIGISPSKQWEIGIFGNGEIPGAGVPALPKDRLTILLDFLPCFHRTIQAFGVTIDNISYYDEALRPWINASEPDNPKKKRNFPFRRDPRDISLVWFFDPFLKQYYKIRSADLSFPSLSIWEYQAVQALLKKEGIKSVDTHQIMRGLTMHREMTEAASHRTKSARKQVQKRKEHEKKISPAEPIKKKNAQEKPMERVTSSSLVDGDIEVFGDIS